MEMKGKLQASALRTRVADEYQEAKEAELKSKLSKERMAALLALVEEPKQAT